MWSIEAAVESGRRAARLVERDVTVIEQHKPVWLRRLGWIDDQLYRLHAPQLLDLLAVAIPAGLVALFARHRALRRSP